MRALINRYLAKDASARTLQISGLLRFTFIFLQGILLVQAGVPILVVGQLELIFFVANFMQFFWQNGAHRAMMSWKTGSERVGAAGAIFGAMHIQAVLGTALLMIIALLPIGDQYAFLLTPRNLFSLATYVFFSIPVGAIVYVYLVNNKLRRILWYTGLTYGVQVGLILWTLISNYSVDLLLALLAVFAFVRWLAVLLLGAWFRHGTPGWRSTWAFFIFAIPLVLHAFYSGIMDYVDGWIVSLFFGEEMFAYYRFGARELPLNAMLIGGLVTGMVHQFQQARGKVDNSRLKEETARMIKVLMPFNCVLVLVSPLIYPLLYNDDFILSARIFNIYALTLLSRIVLNQVYCYVDHRNWILTWSTAGEIVLNIILSLVLMRWLGLPGIPIATVIAYAVQKSFLIFYVQKKYQARFVDYMPGRLCFIYAFALLGCVLLAEIVYF